MCQNTKGIFLLCATLYSSESLPLDRQGIDESFHINCFTEVLKMDKFIIATTIVVVAWSFLPLLAAGGDDASSVISYDGEVNIGKYRLSRSPRSLACMIDHHGKDDSYL